MKISRLVIATAMAIAALVPSPSRAAEPFTINAILSLTGYAAFV